MFSLSAQMGWLATIHNYTTETDSTIETYRSLTARSTSQPLFLGHLRQIG